MASMTDYAQSLRVIGQALEVLNVRQFEMEPAGDDFLVRGSAGSSGENPSSAQSSSDKLRSMLGILLPAAQENQNGYKGIGSKTGFPIDLNYTLEDIERLEKAGRARRGRSEKEADVSSLSQGLRCIGEYLNQKRARLVKVTRESESVTIEYATSLGSQIKERFMVKDIYDLWVRMYLQRTGRTSH